MQSASCNFFLQLWQYFIGGENSLWEVALSLNYLQQEQFICKVTSGIIHVCLWGAGRTMDFSLNYPKIQNNELLLYSTQKKSCAYLLLSIQQCTFLDTFTMCVVPPQNHATSTCSQRAPSLYTLSLICTAGGCGLFRFCFNGTTKMCLYHETLLKCNLVMSGTHLAAETVKIMQFCDTLKDSMASVTK